jgi:hypothetical protein
VLTLLVFLGMLAYELSVRVDHDPITSLPFFT